MAVSALALANGLSSFLQRIPVLLRMQQNLMPMPLPKVQREGLRWFVIGQHMLLMNAGVFGIQAEQWEGEQVHAGFWY